MVKSESKKAAALVTLLLVAAAEPTSGCQLRTQTHQDWLDEPRCRASSPLACYVDANFASAFPNGLELGKSNKADQLRVLLRDAQAVHAIQRDGGKGELPSSCTSGDPACLAGQTNNLVTQTLALTLNAGFDACSRAGKCESFCAECDPGAASAALAQATATSGWCVGLTVDQILKKANCILSGGGRCGLGVNRAVECLAAANKAFHDGTASDGALRCAGETPTQQPAPSPSPSPSPEPTPTLPPVSVSSCNSKMEVAFVADTSNSVGRGEWDALREFIASTAPAFAPVGDTGSRLALISYSDVVYDYLDLDSAQGRSLPAFTSFVTNDMTRGRKSTATGDALIKAYNMWRKRPKASGVSRALILVTDGEPTSTKTCVKEGFSGNPVTCARQVLAKLQKEDVKVVYVETGRISKPLFEGKEDFYFPIRFADLQGIRDTLVDDICSGNGPAPLGTCELLTHGPSDWLTSGSDIAAATTSSSSSSNDDGSSPADYLAANFDAAFPQGLTVGGSRGTSVVFSSAKQLVSNVQLPTGVAPEPTTLPLDCKGKPKCLKNLPGNPLLAQTVALALNLGFDSCSRDATSACAKFCPRCVNEPGIAVARVRVGPCQGMSAAEVLDKANCVLNGGSGCGLGPRDATSCAQQINADFASTTLGLGALNTDAVSCDTQSPTKSPTTSPTKQPTASPTKRPTASPTKSPTASPTKNPTASPTKNPTKRPTASPTKRPTASPTKRPTASPTKNPTKRPTTSPTKRPTMSPTKRPTASPTKRPTASPTKRPTASPTKQPTTSPTKRPTTSPTKRPTASPTKRPTARPTKRPTARPTKRPTKRPTTSPTSSPVVCSTAEVDVMLVVDRSSSITNSHFELVQKMSSAIASEFTLPSNGRAPGPGESRFALVHFGSGRSVLNTWADNTGMAQFEQLAKTPRPRGTQYTNTWAGLSAAFDEVSAKPRLQNGRKIARHVILFSDGVPTTNANSQYNLGCTSSSETGGNKDANKRRFHCVRYWAEKVAEQPDTSVIYVQLPPGGGGSGTEEMENLLLSRTAPLASSSTGISAGASNYSRLLATDYATSLERVLDEIKASVCH